MSELDAQLLDWAERNRDLNEAMKRAEDELTAIIAQRKAEQS